MKTPQTIYLKNLLTSSLNEVTFPDLFKRHNNSQILSLCGKFGEIPVRVIWKGKESGQFFQTILQ